MYVNSSRQNNRIKCTQWPAPVYTSRPQTLKHNHKANTAWVLQLPMRGPYIFEYRTWLTCLLTNERADIILQTLRCHSDKRMTLCIPNNSEWQWFKHVARTEFRNKRRQTLLLKTGKRRCNHLFLTDMWTLSERGALETQICLHSTVPLNEKCLACYVTLHPRAV